MTSTSSQAPLLMALAAVVIAGALTWYLLPGQTADSPSATSDATSKPASSAASLPAPPIVTDAKPRPGPIFPATAPTRNPVNVSQMVKLPDGTYIPTINGVENPKPLPWPQGRPWSPIVGRSRGADGLDWFVHADGVRSQVRMLFRSDLNREDQTWMTAEPMEARPPMPGEGEDPAPKEIKK